MLAYAFNAARPVDVLASAAHAPDLHDLFSQQAIETVQPGEAVAWEGDAASHVFEIVEGAVRLFRIIGDGRRAIIGFLYAGDLLGVSSLDTYSYSAEAISPTKLRRVPRTRFHRDVAESAPLRARLTEELCTEMAFAHRQMALLGRKTAEERVCSFLLGAIRAISRRHGKDVVVELPMSRLDIADHLGLTIETVSRTISRLTRMGVIRAQGRHALVVASLDRLAEMAGEDDHRPTLPEPQARSSQAVWPH